jgi:hypothetical protein
MNKGGSCPFRGSLFKSSLDVNSGKIKKSTFGAPFFKIFSLEHHKNTQWKIRVGKPFKIVLLKKT